MGTEAREVVALRLQTGPRGAAMNANPCGIVALRLELADAERELRDRAEREAVRLVREERQAWREAQLACFFFDRVRPNAQTRLEAIRAGGFERFPGERKLAEMALGDADTADATYTILSFADRRNRLRCLHGGSERDAVIRETLERGGVYTEACAGRHFQGIVR